MNRRDVHLDGMLRHLGAAYYDSLHGRAKPADVARALNSVAEHVGEDSPSELAATGPAAAGRGGHPAGQEHHGRWRSQVRDVMTHCTVREVMTRSVVIVGLNTGFKNLAEIMAEQGVSALPVLDAGGCVAGIVSETDLLRKEEYSEDPAAGRLPLLGHGRARAAGLTAEDVMSSPVFTISPDASVVEAARVFDRHHLGHLVVAEEDGSLAGILSPRDLLRVYLRTDEDIRGEIVDEIITRYLGTDPARVEVAVHDGMVTLRGEVEHKSMVPLAARLARAVDGVVSVTAELSYAVDDGHRRVPSGPEPQ